MADDSKGDSSIVVNKFTEDSAKSFREEILKRSNFDPNMPIVIYIDSYGGSVDALNSMISIMHQVPNPMITVCIGKAMSCGAILLAAGDYRFCDSFSRVLIHEVTAGTINPVNEMENDVKEARRLNNQMMEFLAKRCGKSYRCIKQMMHKRDSRDINLTAKEALEFGIVDYIGTPIIKPIIIYSIEVTPEHNYNKSSVDYVRGILAEAGLKADALKKTRKKKTRKNK